MTFKTIKEKLVNIGRWAKRKRKEILIALGIIAVAYVTTQIPPDRSFENLPNIIKEEALYRIKYDKWSEVEIPEIAMPEAVLRKWGDETWIKINYPDFHPVNPKQHEGKLKWENTDKEVHFYPLEPRELEENGRIIRQLEQGGFEFEIILKKKPPTNKIVLNIETEGLKFYYQPELTQKEKDNGDFRPENVVGSYAVYHKTQDKFFKTKEEGEKYKAGIFGMFYKPQMIDANGWKVWGEQEIVIDENGNGIQTITIPQDFLDNAVYPIRHATGGTFGYTILGGGSTSISSDIIVRRIGNPGEDGTADSISFGGAVAAGSAAWQGALYNTSDILESPQTATGVISSTTGQFWTLNFTGGPSVSNANFYVAAFLEYNTPNTISYRYNVGGVSGDSDYKGDLTYNDWPSSYPAHTDTTKIISIYCTYTPGNGEERRFMDIR